MMTSRPFFSSYIQLTSPLFLRIQQLVDKYMDVLNHGNDTEDIYDAVDYLTATYQQYDSLLFDEVFCLCGEKPCECPQDQSKLNLLEELNEAYTEFFTHVKLILMNNDIRYTHMQVIPMRSISGNFIVEYVK